jgi:hypothetical protein
MEAWKTGQPPARLLRPEQNAVYIARRIQWTAVERLRVLDHEGAGKVTLDGPLDQYLDKAGDDFGTAEDALFAERQLIEV